MIVGREPEGTETGNWRSDDDQAVRDELAGLSRECALRYHGYEETVRHETDDDLFMDIPFSEAWIEGRRYVMLSSAWVHEGTCAECQWEASGLYLPMK